MKKLESMNKDFLISKMRAGDVETIISCVRSQTPIIVLNSIIFGTINGVSNIDFINQVKVLTDSDVTFFGNPLSAFAVAALHLLKIKEYNGNDRLINDLINSKMEFER